MILGIDEVGRGPWAGPLVVGAVVLGGAQIDGLTDSKKLSKKRREELDVIIRERAAGYGLGWVSASEIDEVGLSEALVLACRRAVQAVDALGVAYQEIIIDGTINFLKTTTKGNYVTTMAKADLLVPSVSAASIIAKVARDNYMAEQDAVYEGYRFAAHVGYGTSVHRAAIDKLGVTPLHRLSFAPLAKYRGNNYEQGRSTGLQTRQDKQMAVAIPTTKKIGNTAEDEAANYLVRQGHDVVDRNWKTKYCEIDIVSEKDGTIYFTEVKYRKSPDQGGGMAAITKKKVNQMSFAATLYKQAKHLDDKDLLLAVATLSGQPPEVEQWLALT